MLTSSTRPMPQRFYRITLPDGIVVRKASNVDYGPRCAATGLRGAGRIYIKLWRGPPDWKGDFGLLTAIREEQT